MKNGESPDDVCLKLTGSQALALTSTIVAFVAVVLLILSVVEAPLNALPLALLITFLLAVLGLAVFVGVAEGRQKEAKWRELWSELAAHPGLVGAEIEFHTWHEITRGPVTGIEIDRDVVTISREWVSARRKGSWRPFDPPYGTDVEIRYGSYPFEREDGTILISLPDGSAVIYLAGHPDLLGLKRKVKLSPAS